MNRFFQSAPILPDAWIGITLVGLFIYIVIEIEKMLLRRFSKKHL
jgi:hypothetical protein